MGMSDSKSLFLSAFGQAAATHNHSGQSKQRYIIMHPQDIAIPYLTASAYTRKINASYSFTIADLTADQAAQISSLLAPFNGSIHLNKEQVAINPFSTTDVDNTLTAESLAATPVYATAPVTCSKITISSGFEFFFPDAMVQKSQFPNVNLSFGTNYSGNPTYCNPHGNYTLATFEQVLGCTNLSVTNIPVFGCGNMITDEAALNSLQDILDYKTANPTKHVGMYFAVNPLDVNPAITAVTQELVNAGVLVCLAAGNQARDVCNSNLPPQDVPGTLQIGATMSPGNQCPWWSNWSDVVPNQQYGDCVNAYLPGVFTLKKFNKLLEGTSFSVPQAAAWCMRWWSENPAATNAQVISAFTNNLVVITKHDKPPKHPYPPQPPFTESGEIRVVKTANYCNTKVKPSPGV